MQDIAWDMVLDIEDLGSTEVLNPIRGYHACSSRTPPPIVRCRKGGLRGAIRDHCKAPVRVRARERHGRIEVLGQEMICNFSCAPWFSARVLILVKRNTDYSSHSS